LKIENLSASPASRYAAPAQKSVPSSRQALVPPAGATQPGMRHIAGEDRRRSQRVLLRVHAQVHVALEGQPTTFDVHTLNVNPRGALVVVQKLLASGTRVVLENLSTREKVACKVVRPPLESAEGFQVPLEFDTPAPQFWRIAFPPTDWRPED
jgi:hypothetical protein